MDVRELYFEWLYEKMMTDAAVPDKTYKELFATMFKTDYEYTIGLDGNRVEDAIDLRYRFGTETNIPSSIIASDIDCYPCSILETLIALAIRWNDDIISGPGEGEKSSTYFWIMLKNLGLSLEHDSWFNEDEVVEVLYTFINRTYDRYGNGGNIFVIPNSRRDLRSAELWYQLCWYIESIGND